MHENEKIMKIQRLKLFNFRGIGSLEVDFTERTTAFVGVNGVGKSTVLDALAIALSQLIWRINEHPLKARPIALDDIRQGADFARIEIELSIDHQFVKWATVTNRKKGQYSDPLRKSDLDDLNEFVKRLISEWTQNESKQQLCDFPLAVYYDVNRAVLDVPMRVREKLMNTPYEVYQDALDHGGADFKRFFIWFRNREDYENEQRRDSVNFRDRALEAVRSAISLFTMFSDLRIRRHPLRMTVVKKGQEFNVAQLSDGERNMLALVGDLARRLSVLNFSLPNPNAGRGVVLLDEIDLHLHPRWQREVVQKLEQTFPNCQFIITTHSPQILGELRPRSVMLMRDGYLLGHAERSLGLSSGEVLEELMEGQARNEDIASRIRQVEREIEDGDYEGARSKIAELKGLVGDVPAVLGLEETLVWEEMPPEEDE
jgi:predicted ATP-binding protein involved in virulence